ncbi:hypothetical protein [Salsipaludibacter albus]|uniref:hypothetical protein n=1 Tax=Salsipaludibacter albus TaxID=2849650 RepID=UPI001EE4909D|nr:hypothetical protein [Salsipaludibacter albus]MBY5163486.1 hypothetical protein [Salsipaludibacter albus]
MSHARVVPALLAVAMVVAGCGGGPAPVETTTATTTTAPSPSPTAGPTAGPTPTATTTANPETTTPTSAPTEDDTLVLAGQFTAFVGADGSGPTCDPYRSDQWWGVKPPDGRYVGLSDHRDITLPGRTETICLLGFDGTVALTVTTPDGQDEVIEVDATEGDGDVGVLQVLGTAGSTATVQTAMWQESPSPPVVLGEPPTLPSEPTPSPSQDDDSTTQDDDLDDDDEDDLDDDVDDLDDDVDPDDETNTVELDWEVPADARGEYTFVARQGEVEVSAVVRVVAPSPLQVGPESEGIRVVTLQGWTGEPVPVGLYRKPDTAELTATDGYRGKSFELVEDLGLIGDGESVEVPAAGTEFAHWCVISPVVEFVVCDPDEPGTTGWKS